MLGGHSLPPRLLWPEGCPGQAGHWRAGDLFDCQAPFPSLAGCTPPHHMPPVMLCHPALCPPACRLFWPERRPGQAGHRRAGIVSGGLYQKHLGRILAISHVLGQGPSCTCSSKLTYMCNATVRLCYLLIWGCCWYTCQMVWRLRSDHQCILHVLSRQSGCGLQALWLSTMYPDMPEPDPLGWCKTWTCTATDRHGKVLGSSTQPCLDCRARHTGCRSCTSWTRSRR